MESGVKRCQVVYTGVKRCQVVYTGVCNEVIFILFLTLDGDCSIVHLRLT